MSNIISCNDQHLPDDLQAIATEASRIAIAAIDAAAAHLADAAKFALSPNGALESASLVLLKLRKDVKPRQMRSLQLRAIAKLSGGAGSASAAPSAVVAHLRAQPSLVGRGLLAELKASKSVAGAPKLNANTSAAIKEAITSKDVEKLMDKLGLSYAIIPGEAATASAPAATPAAAPVANGFTKLLLNIDRVKCQDDVGLELTDFLEDDIRLGGLGADSTGQQRNIAAFKVGDFRRGEVKTFAPNRKFVEFDLSRPGPWPRAFSTTFLMAESDGSGAFMDALRALWAAVHEVVEELVVSAVVAGAGLVGIAVGAPGGPVGMVIGAVVGVAVGLIASYLFASLEDDVFEPCSVTVLLPDARTRFPSGQRKSGKRTENLTHPSASYTLKYEWELVQ